MNLETKNVLITIKAYPNPSKTYGETVCCAGVDLDNKLWIRLYPIPFRDLDEHQKFRKYNIIKVKCQKAKDDHRLESYKVDADTIEIVDHLDTTDKWLRRKEIVLPMLSTSFCQILKDIDKDKSLGIFKPSTVDFTWQKSMLVNQQKRESCYAQLSFLDKTKKVIEQIPFDFYYHFIPIVFNFCALHKKSCKQI